MSKKKFEEHVEVSSGITKFRHGVTFLEVINGIQPLRSNSHLTFKYSNYTGCNQCATPKLPKKVLHIGDIASKK